METNNKRQTRPRKPISPESLSLGLTVSVDGIPLTIDSPETLVDLTTGRMHCHGIRITEEFLIANGFELKGKRYILKTFGNELHAKKIMNHYRIYIWGEPLHDGFMCPYFEDFIYYVHQLQSVCRLCRIYKKWILPESSTQKEK